MTTAYVYSERFLEHAEPGHPEHPDRLRAIMQALEESGVLARMQRLDIEPAALDQVTPVHQPRYLIDTYRLERVLIVDYDVHHGNGTENIFYGDPRVLYVSLHQYPHYPGTGHWRDSGQGEGVGTTINVPLPPGVGDVGYEYAMEELVWPAAERFRPQFVFVSAGFDAHHRDPLAHM